MMSWKTGAQEHKDKDFGRAALGGFFVDRGFPQKKLRPQLQVLHFMARRLCGLAN